MLDLKADDGTRRALKLILIGTLAMGALASLAKPAPVSPVPAWLMAPAWTLDYLLMALAAWLAWRNGGWKSWAMTLYAAQLVLGLFWRHWPGPLPALLLVLAMLLTLAAFLRQNALAGLAFLPCLGWLAFLAAPALS